MPYDLANVENFLEDLCDGPTGVANTAQFYCFLEHMNIGSLDPTMVAFAQRFLQLSCWEQTNVVFKLADILRNNARVAARTLSAIARRNDANS